MKASYIAFSSSGYQFVPAGHLTRIVVNGWGGGALNVLLNDNNGAAAGGVNFANLALPATVGAPFQLDFGVDLAYGLTVYSSGSVQLTAVYE